MEKRVSKLRQKMLEKDIDAAFIAKRENYIYMSGFTGTSAFLVITHDDAWLVTDFRYREQAERQAPGFRVVQYEGSLISALNAIFVKCGVKRLGFEEAYITYGKYGEYSSGFKTVELVPLGGMVEELRLIKDSGEIETIKKAVDIADRAFEHVLKYIRPGVSELEIAAELEYSMKRQGASGRSFETIVASGVRASMPHGVASEKLIENGDVVTLDFGALYNEYCSDMTRTVFVGKPNGELVKIYDIVLEAQLKALEGVRQGLEGREVDKVARDIIYSKGYRNKFGHGLGHGVGLEIHEDPRLSPSGDKRLEAGMIATVEPGIYVEELGGVRIEDMVVVGADKSLILTGSTKEKIYL